MGLMRWKKGKSIPGWEQMSGLCLLLRSVHRRRPTASLSHS